MRFSLGLFLVTWLVTGCGGPAASSRLAGKADEDAITATARTQFTAAAPPKEKALVFSALYDCILHPADPGQYQEDSGLLEFQKVGFLIRAESSIFGDGSPSYQLHEGSEAIVPTGNGMTVAMRVRSDGVVLFELATSKQATAQGAKRDAAIASDGSQPRFVTAYAICQREQ